MNKIPFLYQYKTRTLNISEDSEQHFDKEIQMNVFEDGALVWKATKPATNFCTAGCTKYIRTGKPGIPFRVKVIPSHTDRRAGK